MLVLGSVLFTTLPVAGLFTWQETTRHAQARWSQMKTAADVLASSAAEAVATNDQQRAFTAIRAVSRTPGIIYARVQGAGGYVLAENGTGARLRQDVRINADTPNPSVRQLVLTRTIEIVAPVTIDGQRIGQVVVVHQADGVAAALIRSLTLIMGIAAGALALAMLGVTRLQAALTRPLVRLTTSVGEMAEKGDFSQRVTIESRDEVGRLVDSFNAMLDAIRTRDTKIEAHVKGLEGEVAARTADYIAARDEAVAATVAKSDFLATMSHEIRTPMNGVMVMAELLAAESLPARARRHAQTIAKSGRSLLAVINDILDFSKIEAGKLEVETTEVDILDLCDDIITLFQAKAREKGLELAVSAHPDAPRFVPADPVRLGQVLSNLISNALKFTDQGLVAVAIEPGPGRTWRLSVRDTGIGIAADKLPKIFAAFSQEDQTTTRRFGGTGLGLTIARRLVEAMGGEVSVTSQQGRGTRFLVVMPAGDHGETCAPPQVHHPVTVDLRIEGPLARAALARRLQAAGITVDSARADAVIADKAHRSAGDADPAKLILLADPDDGEADGHVRQGQAACLLPAPVRHRDLDALIISLRDGQPLALSEPEHNSAAIQSAYPRARVLVVDDAEVNREVAMEALSRFGITAETANDGQAALDRLDAEDFDLVLMDGSMPVLDGFEATRRLRLREARTSAAATPVVALTAHVVGAAAELWREAGMDGVLHKPFTLKALGDILHHWLPHNLAEDPAVVEFDDEDSEPLVTVDEALFDPDVAGPLLDGLDTDRGDFVRKVVGLYTQHAPDCIARLQAARSSGNDEDMASAAHALKSMSLNLGARAVAESSAVIERAIREEGRKVMVEEIANVRALLEATLVRLDDVIEGGERITVLPEDPEQVMLRELRDAIAAEAFEMKYQPIFDRNGVAPVSAEALIRWNRPDGTPVGPDVFIPLAEREGLICAIGVIARRKVLREAANWSVPVAVNVSGIELEQPGFVADLKALLEKTGYDAGRLVLEVTETAFMGDPKRINLIFEDLHALGIKLSLDDFGVGYSSLTALHRFPFDKIKIDKEFVHALDSDQRAALEALAIIQAVAGIGRAFGMQVVAEGIETQSQHTALKAAGVHAMQGWLFGKPMSAAGLTALLGMQDQRLAS
ncbi:EAL domain-containing protein [Asticcacaulis sp. AC402]|uniref:EAL domain-containing protein n=1 Tax=Asticcacaulis sp. AC402 TaxID=1282361 RepID=UPI0003C3B23C|nr:EAL domain-containing protein [Asticcacaulis sp. AC402]ESQ73488.1 hypothetical protein ABAC402_18965 [Asticcacaulis sp. AC402]